MVLLCSTVIKLLAALNNQTYELSSYHTQDKVWEECSRNRSFCGRGNHTLNTFFWAYIGNIVSCGMILIRILYMQVVQHILCILDGEHPRYHRIYIRAASCTESRSSCDELRCYHIPYSSTFQKDLYTWSMFSCGWPIRIQGKVAVLCTLGMCSYGNCQQHRRSHKFSLRKEIMTFCVDLWIHTQRNHQKHHSSLTDSLYLSSYTEGTFYSH